MNTHALEAFTTEAIALKAEFAAWRELLERIRPMNDYAELNRFNPAYDESIDDQEGLDDAEAALATDEVLGK